LVFFGKSGVTSGLKLLSDSEVVLPDVVVSMALPLPRIRDPASSSGVRSGFELLPGDKVLLPNGAASSSRAASSSHPEIQPPHQALDPASAPPRW
jgi:hypothetical protein